MLIQHWCSKKDVYLLYLQVKTDTEEFRKCFPIDKNAYDTINESYNEYNQIFSEEDSEYRIAYNSAANDKKGTIFKDDFFKNASKKLAELLKKIILILRFHNKNNDFYFNLFEKYVLRYESGFNNKDTTEMNITQKVTMSKSLFEYSFDIIENEYNGYIYTKGEEHNKHLTCAGNCSLYYSYTPYIKLELKRFENNPCFQITQEEYNEIKELYDLYNYSLFDAEQDKRDIIKRRREMNSVISSRQLKPLFKLTSSQLITLIEKMASIIKKSNERNNLCISEISDILTALEKFYKNKSEGDIITDKVEVNM
jgi:hypothetical protein